jgi:hypothetical protein
MTQRDVSQVTIAAGNRHNPLPQAASPSAAAPPWLAASVAEFCRTQRRLKIVRPIRAAAFGGTLVFVAILGLLFRHSPNGQSVLLIAALCGLPICLVTWFVTHSAQRRLQRRKNHIEGRVYGVGMRLDDQGRVQTDNPHPILILDPAASRISNMSSPSVIGGA